MYLRKYLNCYLFADRERNIKMLDRFNLVILFYYTIFFLGHRRLLAS